MATRPAVEGGYPASSVQRRTLLQLALSASAAAALPSALDAQTSTSGHPDALTTILDRATNYDSKKNGPDKKIWGPAGKPQRQTWFDDLQLISLSKPDAISTDRGSHAGTPFPTTDPTQAQLYINTIGAAMVVKDQIPIARKRIQQLLLNAEKVAAWYAYQVGYKDGYCGAVDDKNPKCDKWEDVIVQVTPQTICDVHAKSHHLDENKLQKHTDALFDPDACTEQGAEVFGHESY